MSIRGERDKACDVAWCEIAASAYRAYAASTGNKNFRGDPMPEFDDLPRPIQVAWESAVRHTGMVLRCDPEVDERQWSEWRPEFA